MAEQGFVVAQHFVKDPYLVKDYKMNVRLYALFVCQRQSGIYDPVNGERLRVYTSNGGGLVYYTRKKYSEEIRMTSDGSRVRLGGLVTTGYVEREHYDDKPLSLNELLEHWRTEGRDEEAALAVLHDRLAHAGLRNLLMIVFFFCKKSINLLFF